MASPVDEHSELGLGSLASLAARLARTDDVVALAPGTLVAEQYRIERVLGAGGMGTVFLAHDLRLDRPVAIKLGHAVSAEALHRLQREAMALARLSHPNVVVVHQVGELGGRAFIAMEHVPGGTLRTWLAARPRRWREIVDMYLAAGLGLAAAHGAGMIHRDFKPDNVLVGDDGRPRVADFGLVRTDAVPAAPADGPGEVLHTQGLAGTPAYMPPEQLAGEPLDARADQFAFAASLWEALYGERPYPGDTAEEVRRAIAAGEPRRVTSGSRGVPAPIRTALRRALAARRDERFPSLAALLAAVRAGRERLRRRLVAGAGVTAVAAAAAAFVLGQRSAPAVPDPCSDGPAQLAPVWNPARADRIAARLPPASWARLRPALAGYARDWIAGQRDACRATRVARWQSEQLLDRRNACLALAAGALDAQLGLLETAPSGRRRTVDDVIGALPDLSSCARIDRFGAQEPPPAGVDRAQLMAAISATVVADEQAVDSDVDAREVTQRAVALARATGWRPQIARALVASGNALYFTGDRAGAIAVLDEAIDLALRSGADGAAIEALADVAWSLAELDRVGEADRAVRLAAAIAARRPDDRRLRRRVVLAQLAVAGTARRWAEALVAARENVELVGAVPTLRAYTLGDLADVLAEAGKPDEALAAAAEAQALLTRELGATNPRTARMTARVGAAALAVGRLDEAAARVDEALAVYRARDLYGDQAAAYQLRAGIARARGDLAGAGREEAAATAATERKARGAAIAAATHEADADLTAGRHPAVRERLGPLLARAEAELGPEAFELVAILDGLARAARGEGQLEVAARHYQRALALATARRGAVSLAAIGATRGLAAVRLASRDPAGARALVAPLVPQVDEHADELPESLPGQLRLELADAAWAEGDHALARRYADLAEATHGIGVDRMVAAWRAAHP